MKRILAALAIATCLPATTLAAGLDYSYADLSYSKVDSDLHLGVVGLSGGQGYQLDGAYALDEHWFLEGAYRYNDFRQYVSAARFTQDLHLTPQSLRLGGGYHTPLGDSMDLVAHLAFGATRTELSQTHPYISTTDDHGGYVVGLGLRIPTELVELDIGLDRDDLGLGQVISVCAGGRCGTFIQKVSQDGTENLFLAALRHDFGPVTAGVEYRRSSYQGWRDLLVSLRMTF